MKETDIILEEAKGKFKAGVIVGVKDDGEVAVMAYPDNLAIAHWLINRAVFELNLHERGAYAKENPENPEQSPPEAPTEVRD
jgi:hypothetical protein